MTGQFLSLAMNYARFSRVLVQESVSVISRMGIFTGQMPFLLSHEVSKH